MGDWLHGLPTSLMAIVVFGATWLASAAIYLVVMRLADGERARDFKGVSPGLLPPLGIIFGLLVAFLASQAWSDADRAHNAVNREASALRTAVLLSHALPGDTGDRLRSLLHQHVEEARSEWPAMAVGSATLTMIPASLGEALQVTLGLTAGNTGQTVAQHEIALALETALDARRQRILVSQANLDWIKWLSLILQATCTLAAVVMVHCDNRRTARLAMGLFSTAIAVCILLIVAHDRPFSGDFAVSPAPLLQVQP